MIKNIHCHFCIKRSGNKGVAIATSNYASHGEFFRVKHKYKV